MFDRQLTRDRMGRVLTLRRRDSKPGMELLEVLAYRSMTRVPVRLRLPLSSRTLELQADGTYLITEVGESQLNAFATNLRLNQRTGRLTYTDSLFGDCVVDLPSGRTSEEEVALALWIFACVLVPPAWPLGLLMLAYLMVTTACEAVGRWWTALLDRLFGAYDV